MTYQWTELELTSFVRGLIRAREELGKYDPQILLAPMMGAVPLVDGLNAVDCNFDNDIVFYVPASSSVLNIKAVLPGTVANVMSEQINLQDLLRDGVRIASIDEVVGGGSAAKVYDGVTRGLRSFADRSATKIVKSAYEEHSEINPLIQFGIKINETTSHEDLVHIQREISNAILSKFDYKILGIEHGHFDKRNQTRQSTYLRLVKDEKVIPIGVERILTMDNPDFCPVSYVQNDTLSNKPTLTPEYNVTREYVDLLASIARIAGNSHDSSPKNLAKIMQHQKYLPEKYR